MQWEGTVTAVGVVAVAFLIWMFLRVRSRDLLGDLMAKRKASAKIVSPAHYMEGIERIPVALALTESTFYYENPDLEASLDLEQLEEVEYDDETATGHHVIGKALRLRSHGHCFEFLMDDATAREWQKLLPPHQFSQGAAQAV